MKIIRTVLISSKVGKHYRVESLQTEAFFKLFSRSSFGRGDTSLGLLLVLLSLVMIILVLKVVMPRVLKMMESLSVSKMKEKKIEFETWTKQTFYGCGKIFSFLKNLSLLLLGLSVAAVVQSSSILTCFLLPLAAREIISLNSAYFLTIGINIGI